jgi:hemerythrin-like domain-containing protein
MPLRPPSVGELPLDVRDGLPDELRVLLTELPRDSWSNHPDFNGLTAFWIERHMLFRKLLTLMKSDAEDLISHAMDPEKFRGRLSHLGSTFVNQLHGHHRVEDDQFFPQLEALEMRLQRGFEMLDRDHHALDGLLSTFTDQANAVLAETADDKNLRERTAQFRRDLKGLNRLIERHLTDEEDLVLPIILKHHVG